MVPQLCGNTQVNIPNPIQATIDHARVALQKTSAVSDALPRLFWCAYSADADQRQLATNPTI